MTSKDAGVRRQADGLEDWQQDSRYQLIGRLGQGGVGVVYEAFDRVQERSVALKMLSHFSPTALYRFKQEFRTATEVHHPNLVRLYELATDSNGRPFFTMELVRGGDFREYTRRRSAWPSALPVDIDTVTTTEFSQLLEVQQSVAHDAASGASPASAAPSRRTPANLDRLRAALLQLVSGVLALHQIGIVHRDLKPSNVVVASDGRLVVLDFGIATGIGVGDFGAGELVGTPEFMAPEQALLGPPQPASDWYSVGAMLFDALVGWPPASGSALEVLGSKLTIDAPRVSTLVRGVPVELDELCAALLDRELQRRPSGEDIISVLGGQWSLRPRALSGRARRAAELVGREGHLELLEQSFVKASEGRPVAVRVAGASGMGKSTLIGRFADELLRDLRATVFSTRVYEEELIPYKALDGLVDSLSRSLLALEYEGKTIPVSANTEALSRLFPILQRVHAIAALGEDPRDDPVRVRQLAVAGLRELLTFVAHGRPLVLWIDDAQWGDADSVSLLVDLIHPSPPMKVLLLLSHREVPADASNFVHDLVRRWPAEVAMTELTLNRLTSVQVQELFLRELGVHDVAARFAAEAVSREAAGNPFLVKELATSARLDPRSANWGSTGELTVSVERLVEERLVGVDAAVRRVLELVAVSGRPVRTEILDAAAKLNDSLEPSIAILGQRRLLRVAQADGHEVLETCHDRIRESVLARLSPELLREHHASLAQALVQASVLDTDALVRHWSGAGEAAHAGQAAIRAGERAAEKLAFKRSEAFYRLALEKLPVDSVEAKQTRRRLAEVLEWDGRGSEAARVYVEAVAHTSGIERSELESAAAIQLLYSGQVVDGVALLRRSLESLGLRAPRTTGRALFWLVFYRSWLRVVVPRHSARAPSEVGALARARVEALYNAAFGMVFIDPILGESMQSQHILTALRQGDLLQRARALALEASHRAREPGPKAAEQASALFETATGLAERTGDAGCVAFVRACRGVSQFLRGRWHDAHSLLETAYQDVPQHRAGWHTNASIYDLFSLVNMGSFNDLALKLPSLLKGAEHRGDRFTSTSLRVAAQTPLLLAMDQPEAAAEQLREAMKGWQSPRFLLQNWRELYFGCEVELYSGRAEAALARFRESERRFARSQLLRVHYIRGMTAFLLARMLLAAGGASREARRAEATLQIAKLEHENTAWTSVLAAMARAARATSAGESALAVAELTLAIELAERAQMLCHAEASRFRLGAVLGQHEGRELRQLAEQRLNSLGVRNALRFAAALLP